MEGVDTMIDGKQIEMASPVFVRHLAARLVSKRRRNRRPLWLAATRSKGRFTSRDLRDAEAGLLALDATTVTDLAATYGIDVVTLLPTTRTGLVIGPDGLISAGGISLAFEPGDSTSLAASYFRLVRTLRAVDEDAPLPLRRRDVEVMDQYLLNTGTPSFDLSAVLSLVDAERRVTVASIVAGAAAIGLAGVAEHAVPSVSDADMVRR